MRLFPQDLGPYWHPRLIGRRSVTGGYGDVNTSAGLTYAEPPPPRMGFLGRLWSRGCGLSDVSAASALPASANITTVPLVVTSLMGAVCAAIPLLMAAKGILGAAGTLLWVAGLLGGSGALGMLLATRSFRRMHRLPLKATEVELLLKYNADPLQQQFLEMARAAVRLPVPATEEERLRTAIQALAAAVVSLPRVDLQAVDADALRAEAGELQAQGVAETDRVTAESLRRRARAVLQRVQAYEQTALLARRTAALQAELEAQIAALREGLAVYQTSGGSTFHSQELAEAALQIATEAAGVASARAELEDAACNWAAPATPAAVPEPARLLRG
jgi:hypothetical protein